MDFFLVHLVFFSPLVFLEEKWVREMKSDLPVGPPATLPLGGNGDEGTCRQME